ncbi:SRPBCC family protein [Dyadobacter sp. OTU695]|uniref:SRPBCC family protein n=1 Tax=Dyadobacter sp. OTU695 TaxID=3043860 RepID=UPI00313AE737
MTKIIKHQFSFAHPVETVWEYLTDSELLASWLMKNDFKPIIGHEFQFRTGPVPAMNFDGVFYCKVLAIVPLKHLSYSWNSRSGDGNINMESVVNWNLVPTEKGTDLFLEHSGFAKKENLAIYNGLLLGWVEKLEKIAKLLNAAKDGNTNP